ncbi:MAG: response regulator [Treponema sp.]|jgi:CheY-like chemotaxis protein|nr:response regulator [Treponema sp.]
MKKKIIVIDDEETVLAMTRTALGADYELTTANSGQEALNLFSHGYIPHLVLLDLNMPEMNGWDTFSGIRDISKLNDTPVAIYSTSEDPDDKTRAQKMGAADFIHKPAKKADLLAKVAILIN